MKSMEANLSELRTKVGAETPLNQPNALLREIIGNVDNGSGSSTAGSEWASALVLSRFNVDKKNDSQGWYYFFPLRTPEQIEAGRGAMDDVSIEDLHTSITEQAQGGRNTYACQWLSSVCSCYGQFVLFNDLVLALAKLETSSVNEFYIEFSKIIEKYGHDSNFGAQWDFITNVYENFYTSLDSRIDLRISEQGYNPSIYTGTATGDITSDLTTAGSISFAGCAFGDVYSTDGDLYPNSSIVFYILNGASIRYIQITSDVLNGDNTRTIEAIIYDGATPVLFRSTGELSDQFVLEKVLTNATT